MQTQLFDHLNKEAEAVNLLPKEGEVYVHHQFFSKEESDRYMDYLINQVPWQQDQMKIYGKEVKLPRLTAWIGEHEKDYSYSGISMKLTVK